MSLLPEPRVPPANCKLQNAGGKVIIDVTVTSAGEVRDPILMKGIGEGFDKQAMKTVRQWKLKPAPGPDGHPVTCRVNVELTFSDKGN